MLKPVFGRSRPGGIALRQVKLNRDSECSWLGKTLRLKLGRSDSSNSKATDSREALDLTSYGLKTVSIVNDLGSGFLARVEHLLG